MEPVRDHELYQGLESALGATVATGLMERLPPPPVDQLATKDDVALVGAEVTALRTDMDRRFEDVDQRFEQVDRRFDRVEASVMSLTDKMDQGFSAADTRFTSNEVALATLSGKIDTFREESVAMHLETLATIRGELVTAFLTQGRQLTFALIGTIVGICTLAFLLSQLAG